MEREVYWLWLADVLGRGNPNAASLLDEFGSAEGLYDAAKNSDLSQFLSPAEEARARTLELSSYERVLARCERDRVTVLTPEEYDYPQRLRQLPDLPLVLFATGSVLCLNDARYVSVVGTRRPSAYGVQVCRSICGELAGAGIALVSGLADGLDGEVHRTAVACGGVTIGILGTPIDKTYPSANSRLRTELEELGGATLSEYGPGCQPPNTKASFLERNRLIAGMSEVLCVIEARTRSGTLNTVAHAERYGRPILAVPGSVLSTMSEGTNELLATHRAELLRRAQDVQDVLGMDPNAAQTKENTETGTAPQLSPEQEKVLRALGAQPKPLEELCADCGLSVGTVLAAAVELELAGYAVSLPGRRYASTGAYIPADT